MAMAGATVGELAREMAAGRVDHLITGSLFRKIRDVKSKLDLIKTDGALDALTEYIRRDATSNAALRAVAQTAANTDGPTATECSEYVCVTISTVPGLLEAVVARLHSDVDAVRLVNNLAANSGVSAALFVKTPGAVEALKVAACKFQLHAFGVALVEAGFVQEVLSLSLAGECEVRGAEAGLPPEQEAIIARGTLALANLSGLTEGRSPPATRTALRTIVKVLDHAARGERLATITWLPPAVLAGLCGMTRTAENKAALMQCGLAPVLARLVEGWTPATGEATLRLTIESLENLTEDAEEVAQALWEAGVERAMRAVARGGGAFPADCTARARRVAERLMARPLAVTMGQHRRLGRESPLMLLDEALVHVVLNMALAPAPVPDAPACCESSKGAR